MISVSTAYGLPAEYALPVLVQEANDPELDGATDETRYEDLGYRIVRKLIAPELCDAVVLAFREDVKPHKGPLLRMVSMREEPHQMTADGFMANALLSVQDLVDASFARFRRLALDVVAGEKTAATTASLLGGETVVVESMFFESTRQGVPLHADGDYMDSSVPGAMIGAWFALEDIHPRAGRFMLQPRSHKLGQDGGRSGELFREFRARQAKTSASISDSNGMENLRRRHEERVLLHRALKESDLPIVAPMLWKGDAMFWGSGVVHGSLRPETDGVSRLSMTSHYIARAHEFIEQGKRVDLVTEVHRGMPVRLMRPQRKRRSG